MKKILNKIDKKFEITKRGGSFKGEFIGGLVNFMVMCYVVIVIPTTLVGGGGEVLWNALFIATILSTVVGTLMMALGANLPMILAPGIGLCAYLTSLVENNLYTFSQALTMAFCGAIIFVVITLLGLREKITNSIPKCVKYAMPAGIGLFIASIGFNSDNSGLIDFFTKGPQFSVGGQAVVWTAVVALFGLMLMAVLYALKVKGSIFYGIMGGTVLDIILKFARGINPFRPLWQTSWLPKFGDLASGSFFEFDFGGVFTTANGWAGLISVAMIIFSFFIVDTFDTIGTLYGATKRAGMIGPDDKIPNYGRAMWADSLASVFSVCIGVPACTSYVESTAGVESGARTGLCGVWTSFFFLLTLFLSPIIRIIPSAATAPALIFVGIIMFSSVLDIDLNNIYESVPTVLTMIIMPLTGNISYGIAVGLIMYTVMHLFTGKFRQVNTITYVLAVLFLLYFFCVGLV